MFAYDLRTPVLEAKQAGKFGSSDSPDIKIRGFTFIC
jgi:hypothetical protein